MDVAPPNRPQVIVNAAARAAVLGLLVVSTLALVSVAATAPVTATATPGDGPTVEIYPGYTLGALDPVPALYVVVDDAPGCDSPLDEVGPTIDQSRGIVVSVGGTEVYRTGSPNVADEFDGAVAESFVHFFGPSSFYLLVPGLQSPPGTADVAVECLLPSGEWSVVADRDVVVPPADGPPYMVGLDSARRDLLVLYAAFDQEPAIDVRLDGEPVALRDAPEFGLRVGNLPASLAPGLHLVEVSAGGATLTVPVVYDEGVRVADVTDLTTPSTTDPPPDEEPTDQAPDPATDDEATGRPTGDGNGDPSTPDPDGSATEPADDRDTAAAGTRETDGAADTTDATTGEGSGLTGPLIAFAIVAGLLAAAGAVWTRRRS